MSTTKVKLGVAARGFGGRLRGANARVTILAVSGSKPAVTIVDSQILFAEKGQILFRDSLTDFIVELEPTTGVFCYKWLIETDLANPFVLYTAVPASAEVIDFGDLQEVDPRTYAPTQSVVTAWYSVLLEVADKLDSIRQIDEEVVSLVASVREDAEATSQFALQADADSRAARLSAEASETSARASGISAGESETSAGASNTSAGHAAESNRLAGLAAGAAETAAGDAAESNRLAGLSAQKVEDDKIHIDGVKENVDETKIHIDGVKENVDLTKSEIDTVESRINTAKTDILEADDRVAKADTKITQIQTDIGTVQGQINTARDDTLEAKRLVGLDRVAVGDDKTAVTQLKTDVTTLKSETNDLKLAAEAAKNLALAGQFSGSTLPITTDLNTVTTPGVYRVGTGSGTLALNFPVAGVLGSVVVTEHSAANGGWREQVYFPNQALNAEGTRAFYIRSQTNGSWTPWRSYTSDRFVAAATGVNIFELYKWNPAGTREEQVMLIGNQLGTNDLNNIKSNGRYIQPGPANATLASNYPVVSGAGVLDVTVLSPTAIIQRYAVHGGVGGDVRGEYIRRWAGTAWESWRYIPGQRTDVSLGRRIFTWDEFNGREQMVYGDTGWRNVTADLINGWGNGGNTGSVLIRRYNNMVSLKLIGITVAGATSDAFLNSINGFKHHNSQGWEPIWTGLGSGGLMREQGGTLSLTPRNVIAASTFGTMSWMTDDAWPNPLPGTAMGSIPYL